MSVEWTSLRADLLAQPDRATEISTEYAEQFRLAFPPEVALPSAAAFAERLSLPEEISPLQVFALRENGQTVGGVHFKILYASDFAFAAVEYLWTEPHSRRKGFARTMLSHVIERAQSRHCKFILAEADDPHLLALRGASPKEIVTARTKFEIFSKLGLLQLDCPFVQPPTRFQPKWIDDSALLCYPLAGRDAPHGLFATDVLEAIKNYVSSYAKDGIRIFDHPKLQTYSGALLQADVIVMIPPAQARRCISSETC